MLYDKIADLVGNPRVPVVLVGNKKDLEVSYITIVIVHYWFNRTIYMYQEERGPSLG